MNAIKAETAFIQHPARYAQGMARPKSLSTYTSEQLHELWITTVKKEHEVKRVLLAKAKSTVKELEAWFRANKAVTGHATKLKKIKRSRAKRGSLKTKILAYLKPGPQPLKSIVTATKCNYGSVSQALGTLKKEKLVTKDSKRGGAYSLTK